MDSEELCLPVEYSSIEEIVRNTRSNNLPGDHDVYEQETGSHASRLSTVTTVYQVLQDRDRNKEDRPVLVNEDHGNMAIVSKNYGTASSGLEIEKQTRYENSDNDKDRQGHKHHTKKCGCKHRTSQYENTSLNNTLTDFAVVLWI